MGYGVDILHGTQTVLTHAASALRPSGQSKPLRKEAGGDN